MIQFFVFIIYFVLSYFTYLSLRRISVNNYGICYGALVGLVFFMAVPMFFILLNGELSEPYIFIEPYEPYYHLKTTFNIFLGWIVVLLASYYEASKYSKNKNILVKGTISPSFFLKVMLFFYFFITLWVAKSTGAFSEGISWNDSSRGESSLFIIFKNFSNCYRVVVYGLLLYLVNVKSISARSSILFGIFFTTFDMVLSFNRITVLYFFLFFILVYRKYAIYSFAFAFCIIPPAIYISGVWTWFRGMASVGGISIENFIRTWREAVSIYEAAGDSFVVHMNTVFESSNILVLHGIIQRVGDTIPIFYGSTYVLRPLTTFIPSTVWEDKPRVFGTYIGWYVNSHDDLALNSTLFGEAYANFLYAWPLMLFLTLIGLSNVYLFFSKFLHPVKLMSVFIGISIWRFDMNFTVACIYSLVFIYGISLFLSKRKFKLF